MELIGVVVAVVLLVSSAFAGVAAARGLMAVMFFLLLRPTGAVEIPSQSTAPNSQNEELPASA